MALTTSSKYQLSAIERTLKEGAYCAEQLADILNITRCRVNEHLRSLKSENKIHIHKYESLLATTREYPVAFYIYGAGVNAVYTRKSAAERQRAWKQSAKEGSKRFEQAKTKRRKYNLTVRTDVRCDIAASWIR